MSDQTDVDPLVEDLSYRFDGVFAPEDVRAAVRTAREELEPRSTVRTYLPVLISRLATERLTARARAEGRVARTVPEILYVCVHNAGRSQMAAAITRHLAGPRVHVRSAGSEPTGDLNQAVVQVLAERGIDLSGAFPKALTGDVVNAADIIVAMGCGDACPVLPGKRYLDWEVADPAGRGLPEVRRIRDDVQSRVTTLLAELDL